MVHVGCGPTSCTGAFKAFFRFNGCRQWSPRRQPRGSGGDTTPRQDTRGGTLAMPGEGVSGCRGLFKFVVSCKPSRREHAELCRPVSGPAEYPSQGSEALLHRLRSEGARARRVGRLWTERTALERWSSGGMRRGGDSRRWIYPGV